MVSKIKKYAGLGLGGIVGLYLAKIILSKIGI